MSAVEPRLIIIPAFGPLYRALGGCGDVLLRVMCGALLVIAVAVDIPDGRGYSFTLLWAAVAFAIALRGSGKLSLDRWIGREF